MKDGLCFAVIGDVQLGRELFFINWWDKWWVKLFKIPYKEAVAGEEIETRLKSTVEWINSRKEIDFVVSIGDLTDSATPEQFQRVREILSELKPTFVPMIGNHDVWAYERFAQRKGLKWEAIRPWAINEFEEYLNFPNWKQSFKNFKEQTAEEQKNLLQCLQNYKWFRTHASYLQQSKWFQNCAFTTKNIRFLLIDNNSRKQALHIYNRKKVFVGLPAQDGIARLYLPSREFLTNQFLNSPESKIIIFSHAPLKIEVLKELQKQAQKEDVLNIAGHTHKRTTQNWENITITTTNALYHEPLLLLVQISNCGGIETEYYRI